MVYLCKWEQRLRWSLSSRCESVESVRVCRVGEGDHQQPFRVPLGAQELLENDWLTPAVPPFAFFL